MIVEDEVGYLKSQTQIYNIALKRNKKQHNEIMEFADYYIEDFKEIKDILFIF
jgi:putative hydrolase of the HAD superfamily